MEHVRAWIAIAATSIEALAVVIDRVYEGFAQHEPGRFFDPDGLPLLCSRRNG